MLASNELVSNVCTDLVAGYYRSSGTHFPNQFCQIDGN